MTKKHLKVAFVLGPGGYLGAWLVGFTLRLIKYCLRGKHEVVFVGGTSVGAIIGAVLAEARTIRELLARCRHARWLFKGIDTYGATAIFPFWRITPFLRFFRSSITKGEGLRRLSDGSLFGTRPIDYMRVARNDRITFASTALDEDTGALVTTTNRDAVCKLDPTLLARRNLASASVSPFNPPQRINGALLGDCGRIPLEAAIQTGADVIFVLLPYPKEDERPQKPQRTGFFAWVLDWLAELGQAWGFRSARVSGHLVRMLNDSVIDEAISRMKYERAEGRHASVILKYQMSASRPSLLGYTFKRGDLSWAMWQGDHDAIAALKDASAMIEALVPSECAKAA